jgi:hypothetical protein
MSLDIFPSLEHYNFWTYIPIFNIVSELQSWHRKIAPRNWKKEQKTPSFVDARFFLATWRYRVIALFFAVSFQLEAKFKGYKTRTLYREEKLKPRWQNRGDKEGKGKEALQQQFSGYVSNSWATICSSLRSFRISSKSSSVLRALLSKTRLHRSFQIFQTV